MSLPNWNDLMVSVETIEGLEPEKLKRAHQAADQYVATLSLGIAGIGNLLACAADNHEMGLSEDSVMNVGWMLESLGHLICGLHDKADAMAERRTRLAPIARRAPSD